MAATLRSRPIPRLPFHVQTMISYVTGQLGAGKSLYGARKGAQALLTGRVLATNIRFVDGWERKVLSHSPYYRFASRENKSYMEREISTRYYYDPDYVNLLNAKLHGRGEGRGLRIFDESQDRFNNRGWEDALQNMMGARFRRARKRGWKDYIIAQHIKNTDVAIRRIASDEIRVINWKQQTRVPIIGTSLFPVPFFLAMCFPVEETAVPGVMRLGKVKWRELYRLGWWSKLYDTFDDVDFDDELGTVSVYLPFPVPQLALAAGGEDSRQAEGGAIRETRAQGIKAAGGHAETHVPPDETPTP